MAPLANMTLTTFAIKGVSTYGIKLSGGTPVDVGMFIFILKFLYHYTYV